jgi:hypothetical protein
MILSKDHDLCASQSDMRTGCGPQRTLYRKFVGSGGPIIIEEILKIDLLVTLFLLCPQYVTALHLDLQAHLGCRSNVPTYAHNLASLRSEEIWDIQALAGCPGQVIFPLQDSLLISYKQPQCIFRLWDVLQYNSCVLPSMSGVNLN